MKQSGNERKELKSASNFKPKDYLFRTVWKLHSGELFGIVGRLVVDAIAVVLIILCVTGIILFILPYNIRWNRKREKKESCNRGLKRLVWNQKWHNRFGVYALEFTLFITITGTCLRPPLMIPLIYNYVHLTGRTVDSQFSQPRPSSATWRIDYDHQFCTAYGLNAAISGRFLSEPDTDQEKHDTAYQIWKFTLQQRLFDGISIDFNIDNLFNNVPKAYYWSSCMTKGRTWSLGISMDVDRFVKAVKK